MTSYDGALTNMTGTEWTTSTAFPGTVETLITYDFESDTTGATPANTTVNNGTFIIDEDQIRSKTLKPLSSSSGNTAIITMDSFPANNDYSITVERDLHNCWTFGVHLTSIWL